MGRDATDLAGRLDFVPYPVVVRETLDPARTSAIICVFLLGVQTSPLAGTDGLSERGIRAFAEFVVHGLVAVKR